MLKQARQILGDDTRASVSDRPVSIHVLDRDESTRAAARSMVFLCPGCERRVVPVFFEVFREGRRHSEQSHFRLKRVAGGPTPMLHMPSCEFYVEPRLSTGRATSAASGTPARRLAPSIFVDRKAESPVRSAPDLSALVDEASNGSSVRGHRRLLASTRVAESRVDRVGALASHYHHGTSELADAPLHVPGCPAVTYGGVFRRIDATLAARMPLPGQRFIYWFHPTSPLRYGPNWAFALELRTAKGKRLRVYLRNTLDDGELPASVSRGLRALDPKFPLTLYVLGSFVELPAQGAWELVPESVRHIHLEHGLPTG